MRADFDPSLFRELHSPAFKRWDDQRGGSSTGPLSVLQMWRELEGENVVNNSPRYVKKGGNDSESSCLSSTPSIGHVSDCGDTSSDDADEFQNQEEMIEQDDNNSVKSEQSSDMGDIERERVRQIFREWMINVPKSLPPNKFPSGKQSKPQHLRENEFGRVRIMRENVERNMDQSNCSSPRDGVPKTGSQVVKTNEKHIRRLCGRQTLIDLLIRAQCERQQELQVLSSQKPVSCFSHRNRLQALLRGRFLWNERLVPNKKQYCAAATELRSLRQRSSVSDLREGFLSKSDEFTHISANGVVLDPSLTYENRSQSESICGDRNVVDGSISHRSSEAQVTEVEELIFENDSSEEDAVLNNREDSLVTSEIGRIDYQFGGQTSTTFKDSLSIRSKKTSVSESLERFHDLDENRFEISILFSNSNNLEEAINEGFGLEEIHESVVENNHRPGFELSSVSLEGLRNHVTSDWLEDSASMWFHERSSEEPPEMSASHSLQDTIPSWLDMPPEVVSVSTERMNAFYFCDDEKAYSTERRELVSRRRVSSLLQSSFREKLNQVLLSQAQRLGHVSNDWEASIEDSTQREHTNDHMLEEDEDGNGGNCLHISKRKMEIENEVVSQLRLELENLQKRMSNVQGMLDACMDMQVELQTSIHQEVSTTVKKPFSSTGHSPD